MGLGYEGWVKVGGTFALGTGMSVPRARSRLESASGYGGTIGPGIDTGIGSPFTYDWDVYDGSGQFDLNELLWDELVDWILNRQTAKEVKFSTRKSGIQTFSNSFWNNISFDASEGSAVNGSFGFVSVDRDTYAYGVEYPDGKVGNDEGGADKTTLCNLAVGMAPPLNPNGLGTYNLNPIPYWRTSIVVASEVIEFMNWSLSFSQDVVKFFACEYHTEAQEPKYLAVGPMTVMLTGSYMMKGAFLGDTVDSIMLNVGTKSIELKRVESTTESDELPGSDSLVPLSVDYAVYELEV